MHGDLEWVYMCMPMLSLHRDGEGAYSYSGGGIPTAVGDDCGEACNTGAC